MIGVVVVTHGQLATELLNATETIVGDLPRFAAVSIGWHEHPDDARGEIEQAIARVEQGAGVLILTDMFGGTASNLAMSFLSAGEGGSDHRGELADADQAGESPRSGGPVDRGTGDAGTRAPRDLGGLGLAAGREGVTIA